MKTSIRSKRFTMGIVLFLAIILLLSILSVFFLNRLSKKAGAILKENHYSVVFAQDMSVDLIIINQEIINCFLTNKNPDTILINKELKLFINSLQLEQNNLTEIGEGNLVSGIEKDFNEYRDSVVKFMKSPTPVTKVLYIQKKYDSLYQQLLHLSQINEKAIEEKTNDVNAYVKKATIIMTIIATLCFLIAYGFAFIFASYFNERFYQLYNGLKEIASGNYSQKLYFKGNDEISEISLIINEMTEKLTDNNHKNSNKGSEQDFNINDIQELKEILIRMKSIKEQASELISKLEKKK
jgi:two-component system, NtrC family, sensor histidine kinase KinB